jgi:hypothetical protein
VASTGEPWPQAAAVRDGEQRAFRLAAREDVLVEAQLTAGTKHALELRTRPVLVRDAAEDEADHRGFDRGILER